MQSKNLPADERRQLTVETVVTLAGRQNPSEITTAAIAERMKVTQGALFRHYPSKDAIWQAVMEWVADRLLDRIDRAAADARSPIDALRAIFLSNVEFVVEHPGVPRLMFGELQHAKSTPAKKVARTLLNRYAERLNARLLEAQTQDLIASDVDTKSAAILFIGSIQGLVMQSLLSGDIEAARRDAPGVLDLYLRGICSSDPVETTKRKAGK